MKTRLPRQEFVDALTAAAAVASGRTTKPILNCIKLVARDDVLDLSATDGEVSLRLEVGAFAVDQPGTAVVSAERLFGIVREMPDAEVRIEANDRHCVVRGQGSEFKIFVHAEGDFPAIPTADDEPDLVVDGRLLTHLVVLTSYAAARETSRYAINGVLWEKQGNRLYLIATDGRRLARAGGSILESASADFRAIVPSKALGIFERVFASTRDRGDWTMSVKVTPNQILLRSGQRLLAAALVEGTFPKYEEVIPRGSEKIAKINRAELYSAIKRAALLTTDEARAVRLAFEKEKLTITANAPEQGEARIELPITYNGEPLDIGFNPLFVQDALKVLSLDDVHIELHEPFRPGVITGGDRNDFLYVVMPVSL